jgi:Arm DNA-binding domain
MHEFSWRAGFVMFAVVRHRSPKLGRRVPHSYLFMVVTNVELSGIVTRVPTIHFTERALQSLRPLPRTVEYYDRKTSGLSVRVMPTGKKTFYFVHRAAPASMPGERRLVRVKLGRYPEVDLATARDRVRATRDIPSKADNPAPVVLFKDLATEFIERHCKKKKSWKQDVYWIDAELRPHWNDRPVGTIKRRDVAQLLNTIADPPRNAPASSDHVRAIVSRLFRFGISQGIEAIEYNPAHGIERAKPAGQRHRVLDPDEVKRLWRVWEDEFTAMGRPLIGEQFKLRLLTAQRGGESPAHGVVGDRPGRRALDEGVPVPETEADRHAPACPSRPVGPDGGRRAPEAEGVSRA